MATPVKSVQFRDPESLVNMYKSMEIPAFGVKQGSTLNWKYPRNDSITPTMEDGASELRAFLDLIAENESAAIYTLCLYEDPDGKITDKTPADLSWGFRLRDHATGYLPGEMYGGGYGQMIGEIRAMRKEWEELKKRQADKPEENKLGMIGEIMEMEAAQPILMAIGNRIADLVMGPAKAVGQLTRVSGIPGLESEAPAETGTSWTDDPRIVQALNRLQLKVPDLGGVLLKLADLAEQQPKVFAMYLTMFGKGK